jgi:hypothetical protein
VNFFEKHQKLHKDFKISERDAKSVIFGIDMSIDNMIRDAQKIFSDYIESVDMLKNHGTHLAELSTKLESDQIDENHFKRVGGQMRHEIAGAIERMNICGQMVNRYATRYFDLCERIAESLRIRDILLTKTNSTPVIVKPDEPV